MVRTTVNALHASLLSCSRKANIWHGSGPRPARGTGIVHLANGRISGGDTVIAYDGTYELDGDQFIATLTTRRHAAGQPSVFGIDDVELTLTGTSKGTIATCSGAVPEVPGRAFEVILSQDRLPRRRRARRRPHSMPTSCRNYRRTRAAAELSDLPGLVSRPLPPHVWQRPE